MKRIKNRGFSKPAILAVAVLLAAAGGTAGWYFLGNKNDSNFSHLDESTRDLIDNVDMSSAISVASALQNSVITSNYLGTDILVNRLRELEFTERTGQPASTMTKDDLETRVDISSYLVPAAVDNIENKIKEINSDLNNSMSEGNYRQLLDALTNLFQFYVPKLDETRIIENQIQAYNAYSSHPDYMISDIRAMYGPYMALAVCRYIIGLNDYSRISAQEMLDYIVRESKNLIKQIPIQLNDKQKHYSAADFSEINARKLYELSDIDFHLPRIMSFVLLIKDPSILEQQKQKAFTSLQEAYQSRVNASQNYLFRAKTFFQCQATTSTSFGVEIKELSPIIKNVSQIGSLTLNAVKATLRYPLRGCAEIDTVYILFPELKGYQELMTRSERKMSDDEREMVKRDLELLKKLESGTKKLGISIASSDVAAVENHLELNPEQGYFIGRNPNQSGLLFNALLPSASLLKVLEIAPEAEPVFSDSIQSVHKRKQAIFKLGLIEDYTQIENDLAELDFDKLSKEFFRYITVRNEKNRDILKLDNATDYNMNVRGFDDSSITAMNEGENNGPDSETPETVTNSVESSTNMDQVITELAPAANDNGGTVVVSTMADSGTDSESEAENTTQINTIVASNDNESKEDIKASEDSKDTKDEGVVLADSNAKDNSANDTSNVDDDDEDEADTQIASNHNFLSPTDLRKAAINKVDDEIRLGSTDAMYEKALRLISGTSGVKRNHAQAAEILKKAVNAGSQQAEGMLGSLYVTSPSFSTKQKKEGAALALKAAANGIEEAYSAAGTVLLEGRLAKRDYKKAFEYLRLAAENDDRNAQYKLATMYLDGDKGVNKDLAKAYPLLTSASKTVPDAAYRLAELARGNDLPNAHDEALADEMYIFAASRGVKDAYKYAGIAILKDGGNATQAIQKYLAPYAGKKDPEVNAALLNYYVKKNNRAEIAKLIASAPAEIQAQYPVESGNLYAWGRDGYKQDVKKAEELYRKGIADGIPEAYCGLGDLFYTVPGAKKDLRAAVGSYTKGADKGAAACQRGLGIIYSTEKYHTRYTEAYNLLSKAAAQNPADKVSAGLTALMTAYGMGVKKDEAAAVKMLSQIKSNTTNAISLIIQGDPLKFQQAACGNTALALASALKSGNRAWYAYASMSDLLAYGEYLAKGGTGSFDNVKFEASKVCRNVPVTILHDAQGFKFTTDNSTPEKQYRNAMALFAGNGTQKNYDEAYKLIKQAADAKHAKALNNLGIFQLFGIGTKQFNREAFTNLVQASSHNDATASLNAAAARKFGWGGIKGDSDKAMDMIYTAISRGNRNAAEHLLFSYTYGVGFSKNDERAFEYAAKAFLNEVGRGNK